MTTKITLTNIDSTGDYSELVDAAYNTANAASSYANSAYAAANNSTDTWVRSAANAASSYANSAYAAANTKLDSSGGTISGNITITGNIVPTTANTYYLGSEASPFHSLFVGSGSISIGGLVLSNSNGSLGVTSPTGPSLDFTAISSTANAAYTQANTATTNAATADQRAVTSGSYANSAYAAANNATDTWVRNAANAAGSYANSAYSKANSISAGITFTANSGVPPSANVGDQWWSTTDDILYEYINDGTSNVWLDISSSAITSTTTAASSTNNARTMINAYVFGS